MKQVFLWALLALPLAAFPARADEDGEDEAMAIAHRYGAAAFERVEELKFTFNLRQGTSTVTRTWSWDRTDGDVTLTTKEGQKTVTRAFRRGAPKPGEASRDAETDRWFIQDRAWLLFPVQIASERSLEATLELNESLPIPPGNADRLIVEIPPSDVYELYYRDDHVIRQWAVRRGGPFSPAVVSTWEDHARLGPLLVALRRRTSDDATEIWFSDVEARLRGSNDWIRPAPGT